MFLNEILADAVKTYLIEHIITQVSGGSIVSRASNQLRTFHKNDYDYPPSQVSVEHQDKTVHDNVHRQILKE